MNLTDLLRMSIGNLKRRKLRTFLTVLGVIIGTASIVVMISLGLGLQQSLYQEVEQSGGLTMLTVSGKSVGESGVYYGEQQGESDQYITDASIREMEDLPHVTLASPTYDMYVYALKGKYIGYVSLVGTTREAMEAMHIPLRKGGTLPQEGGALEMVFGNGLLTQFYEKNTGKGYWETGELPDVNLEKDALFLILDTQAYDESQEKKAASADGEAAKRPEAVKKTVVRASGVVEGDIESYNNYYYYAYCDIQALKAVLKKEFAGRVIPGQPTTKTGKPYKFFAYSSAKIKVDSMEHVEAVSQKLRDMGYNVSSNIEYMESMKKQFVIVQAVLGGIGAVSLLVAAIGIANTMMMSIYERTKEIGVFKVLGCSLRNIRQMFLLEAAFIGLIGGVTGNLLSFLISAVVNGIVASMGKSMGLPGGISLIPIWLVLASMGFAVLVGMTAGYFPARRAMRLSPLAAIRNE